MEIKIRDAGVDTIKSDLLVLPVPERGLEQAPLRVLDRRLGGQLQERVRRSHFSGAEGSTLLHSPGGKLPAAHILVIGLGPEKDIDNDSWRKTAARARREATSIGAREIALFVGPIKEFEEQAGAAVEGALLASYQFTKYRSNSTPPAELKTFTLFKPGLRRNAALDKAIDAAQHAAAGVFLARDLINEPPSVATARFLGEQAERLCRGRGLSVEVWGKRKIEAMKLAGLLAVNRGSQEEPRFIVMRYTPAGKPRKKVALVGKGITFDSGGLSLKSSKSMETMKLDMAGGAAIIATMSRLPYMRTDIEVTGYVPTTDNLPGGNAQKPGDVIRYLNGKTIEVLNTDAEGRLILADALAFAAKQKPDCMINLATLTGACMVALGNGIGGLFSNDQDLAERLLRCARQSGEKLWQLPLVKEYREMIKSSVADMKNIGGAHAGAITAALILQEFVADVPWAHLDIAGPAFAESDQTICPKGGTGFGVRTLLKFLSTL
jgi:leucyl aminopeptidase